MTADYRHFEIRHVPEGTVILLSGPRLLDRERFPYHELQADLMRLLEVETPQHVILDFSRVQAIDTMAVQAIVGLWKRLRTQGGSLSLCCLQGVPLQILRLVRFDLLFKFHESQEDAIAALGS
jgi:anti-anti-sigma factor